MRSRSADVRSSSKSIGDVDAKSVGAIAGDDPLLLCPVPPFFVDDPFTTGFWALTIFWPADFGAGCGDDDDVADFSSGRRRFRALTSGFVGAGCWSFDAGLLLPLVTVAPLDADDDLAFSTSKENNRKIAQKLFQSLTSFWAKYLNCFSEKQNFLKPDNFHYRYIIVTIIMKLLELFELSREKL